VISSPPLRRRALPTKPKVAVAKGNQSHDQQTCIAEIVEYLDNGKRKRLRKQHLPLGRKKLSRPERDNPMFKSDDQG
jgi:hypothetical protein